MRAPLDVVLSSTAGWPEKHIAGRIDDYQQTTTSPGGYATITFTLREPILSDLLLKYQTVGVYDRRSGEQVHGGRLVIPGKSTDNSGDVWQVQAIGEGPAHMQDRTVPYVVIESQLDGWYPRTKNSASGTAEIGTTPDQANDYAITLTAPGGSVVGTGLFVQMGYDRLADCGMTLGSFGYTTKCGKTDANWQVESGTLAYPAGSITNVSQPTFSTTATARGPFLLTTDFPATDDTIRLAIRRTSATNVADDTSWGAYYNVYVRARLKDKLGADRPGSTNSYVLASDVVADLLGRFLTRLDGSTATVTTTTHQIDQLAYIDGVTPQQVIEDLLVLEQTMTWHVWGTTTAGLYRFEFISWVGVPRYDVTVLDGFDSPAPTDDLYNEVKVKYVDQRGRIRYVTRTQTVAQLGSRTQSYLLDLGTEPGSNANAVRAGDQFLAQHAAPPNAGTLTIKRPVYDTVFDRMVWPWEIRPGSLFRVRGVRPYVDALNATDRDGVTVFRGTSAAFSDADGACVVQLDAPPDDDTTAIAKLEKKRRRPHGGK